MLHGQNGLILHERERERDRSRDVNIDICTSYLSLDIQACSL